eukprot:scaffold34854_cov68-Phaeocystis_antarctica.AAC.3
MQAAGAGHIACVRALLEAGADIFLQTKHQRTALDLALRHGGRSKCLSKQRLPGGSWQLGPLWALSGRGPVTEKVQPWPRMLKRAASKVADSYVFDHVGTAMPRLLRSSGEHKTPQLPRRRWRTARLMRMLRGTDPATGARACGGSCSQVISGRTRSSLKLRIHYFPRPM